MDLTDVTEGVLISSIAGQMDSIAGLMGLIFVLNAVTLFSILTGREKLVLGPLESERRFAGTLLSLINTALMGGVVVALYRLVGLVGRLPPSGDIAARGIATLSLHPFLLNPYANFGKQQSHFAELNWMPDLVAVTNWLSLFGFYLVLIALPLMASSIASRKEKAQADPAVNQRLDQLVFWIRVTPPAAVTFLAALANLDLVNAIIRHIDDDLQDFLGVDVGWGILMMLTYALSIVVFMAGSFVVGSLLDAREDRSNQSPGPAA